MSTQEPLTGDDLELADIFARYGPAYLEKYGDRIPTRHKKVMEKVLQCRTSALGGQVYECEPCFQLAYAFHSCQDRHCPKCGADHATNTLAGQTT